MSNSLNLAFKKLFDDAQQNPKYKQYIEDSMKLYKAGVFSWPEYMVRLKNVLTQMIIDEAAEEKKAA